MSSPSVAALEHGDEAGEVRFAGQLGQGAERGRPRGGLGVGGQREDAADLRPGGFFAEDVDEGGLAGKRRRIEAAGRLRDDQAAVVAEQGRLRRGDRLLVGGAEKTEDVGDGAFAAQPDRRGYGGQADGLVAAPEALADERQGRRVAAPAEHADDGRPDIRICGRRLFDPLFGRGPVPELGRHLQGRAAHVGRAVDGLKKLREGLVPEERDDERQGLRGDLALAGTAVGSEDRPGRGQGLGGMAGGREAAREQEIETGGLASFPGRCGHRHGRQGRRGGRVADVGQGRAGGPPEGFIGARRSGGSAS